MKHKIFSIFLIVAFVSAISSCQTVPEEHKGAAVGAGVGAATGAATGAVLGKSTKAAVIGGLVEVENVKDTKEMNFTIL